MQEDELKAWAERWPSFFLEPTQAVLTEVSHIATWVNANAQYSQAARAKFLGGADPFLIAQARLLRWTVVTHEASAPDSRTKIKIPDVCKPFSVSVMDPFLMLRAEKARF